MFCNHNRRGDVAYTVRHRNIILIAWTHSQNCPGTPIQQKYLYQ